MRRTRKRLISTVAATIGLLGISLALAACGNSATSTPPAAGSSSSSTAQAAGAVTIKTVGSPTLGQILVNGSGMTLYRFDGDSASPPTSNCNGACSGVWPPVLVGSAGAHAVGFAQSQLGTVTRSDGAKQVTMDGWPLYTYTGDSAAGQTNGQGVVLNGAHWWAVTTTGGRAAAKASSSSSSGAYGGGW